MNFLLDILSIGGALALFIFGMNILSQGLEKSTVKSIRKFLFKVTYDKTRSIFSGFLSTAILQSSSAVSVIIIGIINARLIKLRRALAFIVGANVGTTITLWMLLLGIEWKIESIILPLILLAVPFYLSRAKVQRAAATALIGFCIVFLSLGFLKDLLPTALEFYDFFHLEGRNSIPYGFLFGFIGFLITALLQSSSASTVLIALLVTTGVPIELGMAMILGANIGTTITAHLASLVASYEAKLLAVFHTIFNLLGSILFFILIPILVPVLESIIPNKSDFQIALFHTSFNVFTAILISPFITPIYLFIRDRVFLFKGKDDKDNSIIIGSKLAEEFFKDELQIKLEQFLGNTQQSIALLGRLITEGDEEKFELIVERIRDLENEGDKIYRSNQEFITHLGNYEMSTSSAKIIFTYTNMIDILEIIGDMLVKISATYKDRRESKSFITPKMRTFLLELQDNLSLALKVFTQNLSAGERQINMNAAYSIERRINSIFYEGNEAMISSLDKDKIATLSALYFKDLISSYELIADQIFRLNKQLQSLDRKENK